MAKEYIEREMALKKLCEGCCEYDSENTECSCNEQLAILGIPAADVAPVVHGKWRKIPGQPHLMQCSECELTSIEGNYNYCPNCGCRMDGGNE